VEIYRTKYYFTVIIGDLFIKGTIAIFNFEEFLHSTTAHIPTSIEDT